MAHTEVRRKNLSLASPTLVGMLNHKTRLYDQFMREVFCMVHGRFHRKCKKRRDGDAIYSMMDSITQTADYNLAVNHSRDAIVLQATQMDIDMPSFHGPSTRMRRAYVYRGTIVLVLVCALRRMGVGVQSIGAIVRHVRVRHLRKQSAYKDFARECAHIVSTHRSYPEYCLCKKLGWNGKLCWFHAVDAALRSLYTDIHGNAVYCMKFSNNGV